MLPRLEPETSKTAIMHVAATYVRASMSFGEAHGSTHPLNGMCLGNHGKVRHFKHILLMYSRRWMDPESSPDVGASLPGTWLNVVTP